MKTAPPLLFLVGVATLVAELLWTRGLATTLGSDLVGVALGVGVFLLGGAIGSLVSARVSLRPVTWSVAAAAGAVVGHAWVFWGLPELTRGWSGLESVPARIVVALPLALPAVALGGLVPALFRVERLSATNLVPRCGRWIAALDVGSAVGALGTPLLLLPALGRGGTMLAVLVILGLVIGGSRGIASGPTEGLSRVSLDRSVQALLVGGIGFALQVVWTRLLGEILGSSLLVLGIAATAMLVGGALGSLLMARVLPSLGAVRTLRLGWFGWAAMQAGCLVLIAVSPRIYLEALAFGGTTGGWVQTVKLVIVFLCVAPPSLAAGILVPTLAAAWSRDERQLAREAGTLQALGFLGGVAGAWIAGFGLVPGIGAPWTLSVTVAVTLTVGLVVALWPPQLRAESSGAPRTRARLEWVFAVTALAGIAVPIALDTTLLGAGVFQWNREEVASGNALTGYRGRDVLYFADGRLASVSIERSPAQNAFFLKVGGRVEGSAPIDATRSSMADSPTEILLGVLPALFGGSGGRHLVIGVGGGTTASAVVASTGGDVTALEVEPRVIDALRSGAGRTAFPWEHGQLFPEQGTGPVFVLEDARAFLHRNATRWRTVVCQPSEPWLPWSAPLFTPDFYRLVASRLEPGGVAVHWLQLYRIRPRELAAILGGFRAAFPETWLFHPHPESGGIVLVGGGRPDGPTWTDRWRSDGVRECRRRFDWGEVPPGPLLDGAGVDRWLSAWPVGSRDVRSRLEFWLPLLGDRGENHAGAILESLREAARPSPPRRR